MGMRRYRLHRVRQGPREITKTKGKSARLSVAGEFSSCSSVLQDVTTYIGLIACVDHMEGTVGQVKASKAACSLRESQNTIKWVTLTRPRYRTSPSTPNESTHSDSCSAQHGSSLINAHGCMVRIYARAWCHMGLQTANRHDVTNFYTSSSLKLRVIAWSQSNELLYCRLRKVPDMLGQH